MGQGTRAGPRAPGKPSRCPHRALQYSRFLGPSLAEVKDLSGVEIPEKGLDDFCTLWGTRSQEGPGEAVRGGRLRWGEARGGGCGNQAQ